MWLPDTSLPGTVTSERSGGAVSLASSALHWAARTLSFMLARIVQVHAPPTAVHRVQTAIHIHMKCQLWKELQPSSQTSWWTFSLFINSSMFLCWESQNWTHYSLCVSWEQSRGAVSPPLTQYIVSLPGCKSTLPAHIETECWQYWHLNLPQPRCWPLHSDFASVYWSHTQYSKTQHDFYLNLMVLRDIVENLQYNS